MCVHDWTLFLNLRLVISSSLAFSSDGDSRSSNDGTDIIVLAGVLELGEHIRLWVLSGL